MSSWSHGIGSIGAPSRFNVKARRSISAAGACSSPCPSSSSTAAKRAGTRPASPSRSVTISPVSSAAQRWAAAVRAHAFGHRHHQHTAVGLRQQAGRGDGTAGGESGGEIEAAEKTALVGSGRQPTPGKFFLLPLAGEGGLAKRGSNEGRCRQGRHRPLPDVPSSDPTASGHLLPRAGEGKSATPPATRPAPARAGRAAPRRRVRADRSRGVAR